jgi:hypothetical protein
MNENSLAMTYFLKTTVIRRDGDVIIAWPRVGKITIT